jgi:enoyl reductase-like protein
VDSDELGVADKLLKSQLEIESLQRELELKNEINARLRGQIHSQSMELKELRTDQELKRQDRLDITSDMARQYKTMQSELISEISRLENNNAELSSRLSQIQQSFQEAKRDYDQNLHEKDSLIEELNMKMAYMTSEFENMLSETLLKITKKLELASNKWKETDHVSLSENNMKRLEEFQLTRLALGKLQH